ncbi:hypothetical protein B0G77_3787 [Paraburkholderia sp. BL10I2N1]|nr:hypothetical protein B0G77_3787 [Paraburkholderia sp. BL10I2N1]
MWGDLSESRPSVVILPVFCRLTNLSGAACGVARSKGAPPGG